MNIFNYKYLSQEQIKGFDNYKYNSIDNSPIAVYISHPFWNQVVKLYPKWLAPNVLTFGGMLLVMVGFLVASYYDYYLFASSATATDYDPVPNWVWLFLALSTFMAHVMDGTDGKQARRTGTSGPTGELFDHGIDSWLTVPFTVTMFSVFGRLDFSVSAFRQLLVLMSVQIVFLTTHWEKYNTGVLFLSWCYDLSQYALSLIYLITFFSGGHVFWKFSLPFFTQLSPAVVCEFVFYFGCFGMSIPMSLYNISKARKNNSCRQNSLYEAMLPVFSTLALFTFAIVWALNSPTDVLEIDPRAFYWAMGTVFSNIACRLIIAQMTNTRCQPFNWMVSLYIILGTIALFWRNIGLFEVYVVRFLAVFVTLAHIHYTACVVRQMCAHFGINCFSIRKLNDDVSKEPLIDIEENNTEAKNSIVDNGDEKN